MACKVMVLWGLALAASAFTAAGISGESALRATHQQTQTFVETLRFNQILRVCNAYPLDAALDVFVGNVDVKLTVTPLSYLECRDFHPVLHGGDRIDFKMGDTSAGTFTISEMPNGDATLLLVIHRHDTFSTAVSFQSHVFAPSSAPQIAVLDTFKGKTAAKVHIQDTATVISQPPHAVRNEVLRFNSVVAVDPGTYNLDLQTVGANASNSTEARRELVALPREAYIVIRCGVESEDGDSYPQDLIIFPLSDKTALGAAIRARSPGGATLAVLAAALLTVLAAPMSVFGA